VLQRKRQHLLVNRVLDLIINLNFSYNFFKTEFQNISLNDFKIKIESVVGAKKRAKPTQEGGCKSLKKNLYTIPREHKEVY